MRCRETQDRLVAFQDGELARSERELLVEHLSQCAACSELERRLREVTPAAGTLQPPLHIQRQLQLALDVDTILEAAQRPEPAGPGLLARLARWLRRDLELPTAAAVAYVVVLAAALGWGASNWWSLSTLQQQHRYATGHAEGTQDSPAIPAEHWQPAAYNPKAYGLAPDLRLDEGPVLRAPLQPPGDASEPIH